MRLTSQKSITKHRSWRGVERLPGSEHVAYKKRSIRGLERSCRVLLFAKQVDWFNYKNEDPSTTSRKSDSGIVLCVRESRIHGKGLSVGTKHVPGKRLINRAVLGKGQYRRGSVRPQTVVMQTSLHAIVQAAQRDKEKRFKSLYSFLNREMLREAYRNLNKDAAPGADNVTYEEYGKNLEEHLIDLEARLKEKRYHAKVVRRVNIPKGNGKTRPLGIPVLEDKLVQWVVREILQALFEPLFYKHSYAYRPGRSARQAVEQLWNELMGKYKWVVEVDIRNFFGSIDHSWMIKMVEKRVDDKSIIWLIKQWLRAGVICDDGTTENPEQGTPQGGVISPILANIYLHYVLDQWFRTEIRLHSDSDLTLVRYADDFVAAFRLQQDAERFYELLPARFAKFGLVLADDKTRKILFTRFDKDNSKPFNFLGFTFFWGTSRKGNDAVKVYTSRKKIHRTLQTIKQWIKENRNRPISWIMEHIKAKLRGHKSYFGIQGNSSRIWQVAGGIADILYKWLNRRSQRKSYNRLSFRQMLDYFNYYSSARIGNYGVQVSFLSYLC
jgi:RNA-directed DNA polymerase